MNALRFKRNAGYTLVEMMMTVMVVGLISLAAPALFANVTRSVLLARAKTELQNEARAAIVRMNAGVKQALAGSIVVSSLNPTEPPYSRIAFSKVPRAGGAPDVIAYFQRNGDLVETVNGVERPLLSKNLKDVHFTFPRSEDATLIDIHLALEKPVRGKETYVMRMSSQRIRVMNP